MNGDYKLFFELYSKYNKVASDDFEVVISVAFRCLTFAVLQVVIMCKILGIYSQSAGTDSYPQQNKSKYSKLTYINSL